MKNFLLLRFFILTLILCARNANPPLLNAAPAPFAKTFWQHWSDGRAEMSGYDLTIPRYGELRRGTAVLIFVTEPFSNSERVKADSGKHPKSDELQVMKLNLVRDFPTGIYDYNVMTSAFLALEDSNGLRAGMPAKVSFTSQEWCGHVYDHLIFKETAIERVSHSYFDGEADQQEKLNYPRTGMSEDILFFWARGLAEPFMKPGESRNINMLLSLTTARFQHIPLSWEKAQLFYEVGYQSIQVPAGTFKTRIMRAETEGGRSWTFYIDAEEPHRVIKWITSDGEKGELLASERLAYWKMNAVQFQAAVKKLGLLPRQPRMP